MRKYQQALSLTFRNLHDETIQIVRNADLAGQTRVRTYIIGEIQHVLFHCFGLAGRGGPLFIHIDMACGAGAGTAALRTALRMAFSITVEPFSAFASIRAPS